MFILHECWNKQYSYKKDVVGIFDTFALAHQGMMCLVQERLLCPHQGEKLRHLFLPSQRFRRDYLEPENKAVWYDMWQDVEILPKYTITRMAVNTLVTEGTAPLWYDPDLHIKNTIVKNDWNNEETEYKLSRLNQFVRIPSGQYWDALYKHGFEWLETPTIMAWIHHAQHDSA